jgi:hypothetical protein
VLHCRIFYRIIYLPDANHTPPPEVAMKKYLQTLPNILCKVKLPLTEDYCTSGSYLYASLGSYVDLKWAHRNVLKM